MSKQSNDDFKDRVGIVGLGPIGRNFALNLAALGVAPAVYDLEADAVQNMEADIRTHGFEAASGAPRIRTTVTSFIAALKTPRVLFLFVPAGAATDAALGEFAQALEPGDVIVDGGNSFHFDTARRAAEFAQGNVLFLGMGLSGGAEGARTGPSLMPGGAREAYESVAPLLKAAAAKASEDQEACLAYMGDGGAGHYVKMVHNGLEYADMQLIAEAYHLLRERARLNDAEQSKLFARWNTTELASYLFEITAQVLAMTDTATGKPVLDVIQDRAGQKGTGRWTGMSGLELGIAVPALQAAVDARVLSSLKDERVAAANRGMGAGVHKNVHEGMHDNGDAHADALIQSMPWAMSAARICIYAQGMALLAQARKEYDYDFSLSEIARTWRAGCIIRSRLLSRIAAAYTNENTLPNLLMDPELGRTAAETIPGLRMVLGSAISGGVPAPVLSSCLAYYDSYRTARLPANIIQAQRDFFGAHGFERVDKKGAFHLEVQHVPKV